MQTSNPRTRVYKKRTRYVAGAILVIGTIWMSGALGRDFRTESTVRSLGSFMILMGCLTMAVQAFTEERFPNTRWTQGARLTLFIGFIVYNISGLIS